MSEVFQCFIQSVQANQHHQHASGAGSALLLLKTPHPLHDVTQVTGESRAPAHGL